MTTNAQKLAWKLVELARQYGDRDFERAIDLLQSGELFQSSLRGAKSARGSLKAAELMAEGKGVSPSNRGQTSRTSKAMQPEQLNLEIYLHGMPDPEKEELVDFVRQFERREILPNGASIKEFAREIELQLPKNIPSRATVLKPLLRRLREISKIDRMKVIGDFTSDKNTSSSLKQWSDLIVRKND